MFKNVSMISKDLQLNTQKFCNYKTYDIHTYNRRISEWLLVRASASKLVDQGSISRWVLQKELKNWHL